VIATGSLRHQLSHWPSPVVGELSFDVVDDDAVRLGPASASWQAARRRGLILAVGQDRVVGFAEAEREGWLGEAEGLRVSLAAAEDKLTQFDNCARRATTITT